MDQLQSVTTGTLNRLWGKDDIMRPFLLLMNCFFAVALIAQSPSSSDTDQAIEQVEFLIAEVMDQYDIPALSISLIYDGEILLSKGYGVMKRNLESPVNEFTLYQIASLSKTFTGLITNHLINEGILDPQRKILAYLPENLPEQTKKRLDNVKLIDVLQHYAGLPRDPRVVKRKDGEPMLRAYTEEELLLELQKIKLKNQPGKKYRYSNLGYAILGYVLERASGLSYEELLKKYVTDKYGLDNTLVNLSDRTSENLATPYRKAFRGMETRPWNTGKLTPASGIYSCTSDLAKLLLLQLKAYQINSNADHPLILTQKKRPVDKGQSYYGFGLFEMSTNRGTLLGHRGDMDGFASEYSFNPDRGTGAILLTSSGGDWLGLLSAKINKILEEL